MQAKIGGEWVEAVPTGATRRGLVEVKVTTTRLVGTFFPRRVTTIKRALVKSEDLRKEKQQC